ncbi:MAG: slipin family protein [Pseudomonadota bacterium]
MDNNISKIKEPNKPFTFTNWLAVFVTIIVLAIGYFINNVLAQDGYYTNSLVMAITLILGALTLTSIKIIAEWDRFVILRFGKFQKIANPGICLIIPIVDKVAKVVDMRTRVTDFSSESTLTKDTVPVNVDAICFWLVWDAKKAILEVEKYYQAIILSAQTALRDIIGTHELAEILTHRVALGNKLKEVLDEKTNPWGITVQSVEIRDIIIPKDLEDAMSKQAQAERERQARIILGTAETEIAEKFAQAAKLYEKSPEAMHLRGMNMLFEGLKEKGSMVIVPSSALETMNLGAMAGLASLSKNQITEKSD